jgi:hypothetical protein
MHHLKDGRFVISHIARGQWAAYERERQIRVYRSAEDIEAALKARNLPPLRNVFQLPKRILNNPPTIDVTPEQQG